MNFVFHKIIKAKNYAEAWEKARGELDWGGQPDVDNLQEAGWDITKETSLHDRFSGLDPEEKEALIVLIRNHLNTISEVSLRKDFRVLGYLDFLGKIEQELMGTG